LALGGRWGVAAARAERSRGRLALVQLGITVVPLVLWASISRVASLSAARIEAGAFLFPLIVVASAILAGVQFPLAARTHAAGRSDAADTGAHLYGADLAGAALGATLSAAFLLPVMGLGRTMIALSSLNAAALVALIIPMAGLGWKRPLA
jgi:predicted membrane-bound spermidine synthase